MTVERGTDILLVLVSAEVYQGFVEARGWSEIELRRWLVDTLARQLLPAAA